MNESGNFIIDDDLEFEARHLVKVGGRRPEYMDGYALLKWLRAISLRYADTKVVQAAQPAEAGVTVKPLEWVDTLALGGGRKLVAFDLFGNEFARMDYVPHAEIEKVISQYKSEKQTDYDQRIRSAIHPTTAPQGMETAVAIDPDLLEDFREDIAGSGTATFPKSNLRKLIAEIGRLRAYISA